MESAIQISERIFYKTSNPIPTNQLETVLSWSPKQEWVEKLEELNGYRYIPIDKIEWLLTRLFTKYSLKITHVVSDDKRCIVAVELSYLIGDTWHIRAGVGCCDVSGQHTSATAFPTAKSIAVRDAAEMIGNIFGANLNRKNPPVPVKQQEEIHSKVIEFSRGLSECNNLQDLEVFFRGYTRYNKEEYFPKIQALYTRKKVELR